MTGCSFGRLNSTACGCGRSRIADRCRGLVVLRQEHVALCLTFRRSRIKIAAEIRPRTAAAGPFSSALSPMGERGRRAMRFLFYGRVRLVALLAVALAAIAAVSAAAAPTHANGQI